MLDDKEFIDGVYRKASQYVEVEEPQKNKPNWMKFIPAAAAVIILISSLAITADNSITDNQIRNNDHDLSITGFSNDQILISGIVIENTIRDNEQFLIIKSDEGKVIELYYYGDTIGIASGERFSAMVRQENHILIIIRILGQEE